MRFRVIDGDSYKPLRGARVAVGHARARTERRGRAELRLTRRTWIGARVSARGYVPKRLVLRAKRGRHTIRLYRRETQWPVYGATPARTQAHPAIELRPPFRGVWARGLGSLLEFPAVVWAGVAYVNNTRGDLFALSMRDGEIMWRRRVGALMASSPGLAPKRGEVVTTSMSPGYATILDMRTGRVKWRYYTGRAEPSPVIRGNVAYFGAANGNVYALDLERRRPRWIFRGGVKITSSPALVGNRLYFGDYAGRVRALAAASGRLVWTGSAGGRVYGTVAVAAGRVFAPSVFSGLSALSARSGALLWRIPVGAYLYSSPAYYKNRVYFATYAGVVYCADARSGRVLWSASTSGPVSGAVQVVAGAVYTGSFGNRIIARDWRTGRKLWTFRHGNYVPLSGNGARLLLHGYSKIWAVRPEGKR